MESPSGDALIPALNRPNQAYVLHLDSVFTEHEIDYINTYLKSYEHKPGLVGESGEGEDKARVRIADVKWIDYEGARWIYDKVWMAISKANEICWNFDIMPSTPRLGNKLQYTRYTAESGGHYDWHIDMGTTNQWLRKLTFTIQMSDPSQYEGGELQVSTSCESKYYGRKKKGSMTIFPSFLQHRVTPVTKGVRFSMVGWIGGPRWR